MSSGTPPYASDYTTLAGNVAKGVGKLAIEDVEYWNNNISELHETLDRVLRRSAAFSADWIERMAVAETEFHQDFFGQTFDLALYRQKLEEYGEDKVRHWLSLGLEVHFLPLGTFTQDTKTIFSGWKVQPGQWYWDQLKAGRLKRRDARGFLVSVTAATLPGKVVLIDTHLKPDYKDGRQMFKKDGKMGQLIKSLRESDKLAHYDYGPQTSRFGISSREWDDHLRSAVAQLLGVDVNQVRLEMAIEANTIPQIYTRMPRTRDGETSTWVWYEEYFEDGSVRLLGGDSDFGGLAGVFYDDVDDRWHNRVVRFLVEL